MKMIYALTILTLCARKDIQSQGKLRAVLKILWVLSSRSALLWYMGCDFKRTWRSYTLEGLLNNPTYRKYSQFPYRFLVKDTGQIGAQVNDILTVHHFGKQEKKRRVSGIHICTRSKGCWGKGRHSASCSVKSGRQENMHGDCGCRKEERKRQSRHRVKEAAKGGTQCSQISSF